MKHLKIFWLLVYLLSMAALFSGCWNYIEVENLPVVSGIAIDKKDGKYLFTSELVVVKGGKESKISTQLLTSEGITIGDATREAIKTAGKKLYFSHAKIVIISTQIAEDGLIPVLDIISRNIQPRNTLQLLVSKGKSAKEILEQHPITSDVLSFELNDMLQSEKKLSNALNMEEWQFLIDMQAFGISAILPTVGLTTKNNKLTPEVAGTGVFKEDKLVGFLSGDETKTLLFIKDKITGGLLVKKEYTDNSVTDISLEILKNKTKLKTQYDNEKLTIEINTATDVVIGENGGRENFIEEPKLTKLKNDFEGMLENNMISLIKKVQEQYESDIFGFGKTVKLNMPGLWKQIEFQWKQIYKDVDVEVHSTINIKNSAFLSKSIKAGD